MMAREKVSVPVDNPVVLATSGRSGSTLLQSILNTNREFLVWGEHNAFLTRIAAAYYGAHRPGFPDTLSLTAAERIRRLRDRRHWPAWDNLHSAPEFLSRFRDFIRAFFADPLGRSPRWGFKEIRYGRDAGDRALDLMFECFPEMRLIVLIREPGPTIFSVLSHWVFTHRRDGRIELAELDRSILDAADTWATQYRNLYSLYCTNRQNCLRVRYEDLGGPRVYSDLSRFLRTSSFDFEHQIGLVKDASKKTDATAEAIRRRMKFLWPQIMDVVAEVRAIYDFPASTPGSADLPGF